MKTDNINDVGDVAVSTQIPDENQNSKLADIKASIVRQAEAFKDNPIVISEIKGSKQARMPLHWWVGVPGNKGARYMPLKALMAKYACTTGTIARALHELATAGAIHLDLQSLTLDQKTLQDFFEEVIIARFENSTAKLESKGRVYVRAIGVSKPTTGSKKSTEVMPKFV